MGGPKVKIATLFDAGTVVVDADGGCSGGAIAGVTSADPSLDVSSACRCCCSGII